MKKHFIALTALLAVSSLTTLTAQAEVGVSVNIGQPGFYGQIDVGDYYPRPEVIYTQPRVIYVEPAYQYAQPIYLRVPPGHAKRWSSYCGRYSACGRPVYFVQDGWYKNVYAPRYQQFRVRGDDGHRYDHDYWDKHGGGHGGNGGPDNHQYIHGGRNDGGHGRDGNNGHGHGHKNGHDHH